MTFNNSTKNYTVSGTFGIASGLLLKNGTGSLTINTANTYAGGTTLNAGTLNINNPTALGTGPITITGGTIDNTSGAAVTLTTNNAHNWNGDFSATGTNNLNLGTGAATLGGTGTNRQVTVNAGTLSIGSINGTIGTGFGLIKAGAGTLTLGSAISNVNGDLNVSAGTLQIGASDFFATGLTGSGTIENGSATSRWVYINNTVDKTFSGNLQNGTGATLGFAKRGPAMQTLAGTNNLGTDLTIENGTVRITGTTSVGLGGAGLVNVGSVANQNAILQIDGGTLNAVKNSNPSLTTGSVANSRGFIKMTSGAINTTSEFHVGQGQTGSYGAFSMSGGSVNSGSWLVVGLNNDRAVLNQSGGSITVAANRLTIGAGGAGAVGVLNVSGGTFTSNAGVFIGENGSGTLNISGTAIVTTGDTRFNHVNTSTEGYLNLRGGSLNTSGFSEGPGVGAGRINFNGGVLKATASSPTFLPDLPSTEARIYAGGATVDDGGFAITIAEALLAPTGSGAASMSVSDGGSGYVDTPVVRLSGGIGTGATAVANVSGGVVTGFTITNPGSGYDPTDFLSATIEGGGATTPASVTVNLAANSTAGGLTKTGTGTLTLSGANTYTGPTVVAAGTLAVTGSISGSASINVQSGANLNVTGLGAGFNLASGQTLKGNGTVTGNVTLGSGSRLSPGETAGTLTFAGNLDLTPAVTASTTAALVFELGAPATSDKVTFTTGALTISTGVLGFNDFVFSTLGGFGPGTYTLFDGNLPISGSLDPANRTGFVGGLASTLEPADNGNDLVLTVVPEPASATLLLASFASMAGLRRFRRRGA
jgi:autotransporter-associated beta strand protein